MGNLFVSSEGGLTAAGYALCLGILILCLLAGFALAENQGANNHGAKTRRQAIREQKNGTSST